MSQLITDAEFNLSRNYTYVRGFSSRVCLVLERYIVISGYEMQAPEVLEEALNFFRVAQGKSTSDPGWFDPELVNLDLVEQVLARMAEKGYIESPPSAREFCESSTKALKALLKTPRKVPEKTMRTLHDFFCTTEVIIDSSLVTLRDAFVTSLIS